MSEGTTEYHLHLILTSNVEILIEQTLHLILTSNAREFNCGQPSK